MLKLGEKIRTLRQAKGMTQEQLVEGFAKKSTLSQIESGKASPSMEILTHIAKKLELRIGELLQGAIWERKHSDLLKVANTLFDNREYTVALTYFRLYNTEDRPTEEPVVLWRQAVCMIETGEIGPALHMLDQVQTLAVNNNDPLLRFQALVQIGQAYFNQSNYKLALHYWFKAKDRIQTIEHSPASQFWSLYNRIGIAFFYMGEHEKSVQYYLEGLEKVDLTEFDSQRSIMLMNLAISLKHLGEYERAEEMYKQLDNVKGELEPLIHAIIQFHYAIFLSAVSRYDEALRLFDEVRKRFLELDEESRVAMVESEIADVYRRQGRYEEAFEKCANVLADTAIDRSEYGYVQRTLGLIYMEQGKCGKAITHLELALQVFEQLGSLGYMKSTHEYLEDCLRKKQEMKEKCS